MAFDEDILAFFGADDFATSLSFVIGIESVAINVIVNESDAEIDGTMAKKITFTIPTVLASQIEIGAETEYKSKRYRVRRIDPHSEDGAVSIGELEYVADLL